MAEIKTSSAMGSQESPPRDKVAASIPKDLSDIEFAKLKYPKQPFMDKLGEPILSQAFPKPESRTYSPPEVKVVAIPLTLESDRYIVTKTSTVLLGQENIEQKVATELKLKNLPVTIIANGVSPARLPEEIVKETSDGLDLVKKQIGITPSQVIYLTDSGYLKFTHEGQDYLASSRFVLKESPEAKISTKIKEDIESNNTKREECLSQLGEIKTKDQYKEKNREFRQRVEALGKEVNGGLFFSFDFASRDDSSFAPRIREEFKNLRQMSSELREAESTLDKISDIKRENEHLNEELSYYKEYTGTASNGELILAKLSKTKEKLDIYDMNINKMGEENANPGILECRQFLPHGNKFILRIPRSDPNEVTTKVLEDTENRNRTWEEYNSQGELVKRSNSRLGYIETFTNGELSKIEVFDSERTLRNIEEIAIRPNGELILVEAVKIQGIESLKVFNELVNVMPERKDLVELGISKLHLNQLKNLQHELSEYIENEDSLTDEINNLVDKVKFRYKMVEDGEELSRDDTLLAQNQSPGIYIWNDPRTRGYFEIEDSWIDWETETNKLLLNKDNPELSKKEFKLLAAKLLFDRREEINQTTVNEALATIKKLRDDYNSTNVIANRNIVFAANSETLERQHHASAEDHHSFGRKNLIEDIRKIQGTDKTFSLIRDENLIIQDYSKISAVITDNIEDKELALSMLQDLQTASEQAKGLFTSNDLKETLYKHKLSPDTYMKILSDLDEVPDVTLRRLSKTKQDLLDKIANTPPPFTFIFDGHGSADAIYLSDGQIGGGLTPSEVSSTIKINSEEFAHAMIERQSKFGPQSEHKDIYIFQNCLNSNFINKVDQHLGSSERPIIIGASEHNQFSYYKFDDKYGARFLSDVILGIKGGNEEVEQGTNIENIINRQFLNIKNLEFENFQNNLNTNPGIYVPNEKGELIQISILDRGVKDRRYNS